MFRRILVFEQCPLAAVYALRFLFVCFVYFVVGFFFLTWLTCGLVTKRNHETHETH